MTRYCAFTLHQRQFALDAARVREIVVVENVTRVPGSGPQVRGLVNLRGQILTCLDLGVLLALGPTVAASRLVMVIEDGEEPICVAIDRIHDVLELADDAIAPVPATVPRAMAPNLAGVHAAAGHLVLLLAVGRLLGAAA